MMVSEKIRKNYPRRYTEDGKKMFDKHKTLYLILITIILTVLFTIIISNIIEHKSNLVNSGTDYIKLVDSVCYRATNENTEKYFNISYVNGWGSVYRNCMLYILNVHNTEFDCAVARERS